MVVTPAEVAADHAGLLFGARRGRCRRGRSSAAPGNAPRSGCLASSAVIGTPQLDRVRPCEQGDAPRAQATTEHAPSSPPGGRGPSCVQVRRLLFWRYLPRWRKPIKQYRSTIVGWDWIQALVERSSGSLDVVPALVSQGIAADRLRGE